MSDAPYKPFLPSLTASVDCRQPHCPADSWDNVRVAIIPGKRCINLYLNKDSQKYKLEVFFEDIRNCYKYDYGATMPLMLSHLY